MPKVGIKGQISINGHKAKFVRDLTVSVSRTEIQVKNKGSEYVEYLTGLIDVPLDLEGDWEPGDPAFDALRDAFLSEEPVQVTLSEGGIGGVNRPFIVTKFERTEPLEDVMGVSASLRLSAEHRPATA